MGYFEEHSEKWIKTVADGILCQVFGDIEGASASVALVKMPENSADIKHYHDNITEVYVFSKGEGIITINGNENQVNSGDCYIIPPNNIHFVSAKTDLEFICICMPPWTEEHEMVVGDNREKANNIEKLKSYDMLLKLGKEEKQEVKMYNLEKVTAFIPNLSNSSLTRVYYFVKGSGQIKIDNNTYEINEGECFKIEPNQREEIIAHSELLLVSVYDVLK